MEAAMRRIRTVLGLGLALASAAGAQQKIPGWTVPMRMSVDSGSCAPAVTTSSKRNGSGKKLRQDSQMRGAPVMASIMNGEDSTTTVVMEQMGMAVVSSSTSALAMAPRITQGDFKVQRADLGMETVEGRQL